MNTTDEGRTQQIIFDYDGTLKRLGGNQRLLADLIQVYLEDASPMLERLKAATATSQAQAIKHAAHSLRGLAANFGAADLIRVLQQTEEQAADGNLDRVNELMIKVQHEADRLQNELSRHREA